MMTEYIQSAMRKARYEPLDEGEGICGEIPGFPGVLAHSSTLDLCRQELASALEDWLQYRTARGLPIPAGF